MKSNYVALFWKTKDTDKKLIECNLCPHNCSIQNNRTGVCKARKNIDGVLYSLNYGEITSIALDPIEKKPLYHFYPGSSIISVGSWGCNFVCAFCQNWEISQQRPYYIKYIEPEELVEIAVRYKEKGNIGIAYTYNEPIVWYEFVYECAKLAHLSGLKNVLVTNGYINQDPLERLGSYIDAMNIDLKAYNNEFYRKVCGGDYQSILQTIEYCTRNGIHVEVTTLIVPGGNDNVVELEEEFKHLSKISKEIPLHLSRYHPAYKYSLPSTSVERLVELYNIAKRHLSYVYLGNVWDEKYESTYCPNCGSVVIIRKGYTIDIRNLDNEGRCTVCSNQIIEKLWF